MTCVSRLNWRIAIVSFALFLIILRLLLPFALTRYVNARIENLKSYDGSVGAVRVNLFKGGYTLLNLRLTKRGANLPVPFLAAERVDLEVEWTELFRGNLTGNVVFDTAELNFVTGPTRAEKQTSIDRLWTKTLESLHPFTINRFEIRDGVIRYIDRQQTPPVDIYVTNVTALATNLTNVRNEDPELPARLIGHGLTTGGGELKLDLRLDPRSETPKFKLAASLKGVELRALNDFLRSYSSVDVQSGRFWLVLNVAAAAGRYQGIAKPFFIDASTMDWNEVTEQPILQSFWESLVGAATELFENPVTDRLATRVRIEGTFDSGGEIDLWATIGGILRNAFLQALAPGIPRPVELPGDRRDL